MVQINFAKGEVQCKIVYYGPSGSGKTANLRAIKDRTPDHIVGDLTTIATDGDSTLFFDFLPLDLGNLSGIQTKIHLYAAPWQRKQTAVRMLVLQGADGIVFVADRSRRRLDDNKAALQDLHDNLRALGRDFSDLPVVFQWNKSDVEDAMPVEELRMELGVSENADSEAVALKGEGVFRALKNITASVLHEAGAVAKRGTSALRGPAETPTPVAEPVHAAVESTPAAAHEPVAPPEPAPPPEPAVPAPAPAFEAPPEPVAPAPETEPEVHAAAQAESPEAPAYEDDVDAEPVQMPSWRQEDDAGAQIVPLSDPSVALPEEDTPSEPSGPQIVPLSDPTVAIPEEDTPSEPLDSPASAAPEFETLKDLVPAVGSVAPETAPSGRRLVRVGPPPNVPTAAAPLSGPLGAGGGWGGTPGEPARRLPAQAPQRAPQARASASRCVLGAILMILWLAATGYLVHLM